MIEAISTLNRLGFVEKISEENEFDFEGSDNLSITSRLTDENGDIAVSDENDKSLGLIYDSRFFILSTPGIMYLNKIT